MLVLVRTAIYINFEIINNFPSLHTSSKRMLAVYSSSTREWCGFESGEWLVRRWDIVVGGLLLQLSEARKPETRGKTSILKSLRKAIKSKFLLLSKPQKWKSCANVVEIFLTSNFSLLASNRQYILPVVCGSGASFGEKRRMWSGEQRLWRSFLPLALSEVRGER